MEQRKRVVEVAMDQIKGRLAVIVHVDTTNTKDSVELAQHAEESGVDAVAAVPPYYYRHNEGTVLEFFRQLVNSVDIPVYVYNNPKTSGFTVKPHFLVKLAELGVKGMKDSGGNLIEFSHFVIDLAEWKDFNFIIGTEALFLPASLLGAKGCISGLANVFPEIVVELYNKIVDKKYEEAAELQLRVNEARRILHIAKSTNAACYVMLKERGVDVGFPKRPILPTTDEELNKMKKEFVRIGLLKP